MITTRPEDDGSLSTLTWLIAGCCAGAALIHFAMISDHTGGDLIVPVGFAMTGIAQALLAALVVGRRAGRGVLWAVVAVNAAALGVWVWSRTAGLPFDPYGGEPEAVGTIDLTAACLQGGAVTLAAGLLVAPRSLRVPAAVSGGLAIAAVALASVVVVAPESGADADVVAASPGGAAAAATGGGDGHGHSHGGAAAAMPAASGSDANHAADMLAIDRARCDLGFNPQAYWDEAQAIGVDTYSGGAMTMPKPSAISDVTRPWELEGRGSEHFDRLISLTSIGSGEVSAAQLIQALAEATDEEYDAWRRWLGNNPVGTHSDAPTPGQKPVASMGHPGPSAWTALVDEEQCAALDEELSQARAVAEQYPTVADAKAAGYYRVTPYLPGIAAHYINGGLVDGEFHLDKPEMLLFDGTDDESRLVGLSYYVRLEGTVAPTQGFVGPNDHYHRHFGLCIGAGGVIGDSTTTEEECAARGGRKSDGSAGWMSHAWVVPGCESPWGVFSGENPILDAALNDASGTEGSEGCAASEARDRYDLSPGESDLLTRGADDQAAGK